MVQRCSPLQSAVRRHCLLAAASTGCPCSSIQPARCWPASSAPLSSPAGFAFITSPPLRPDQQTNHFPSSSSWILDISALLCCSLQGACPGEGLDSREHRVQHQALLWHRQAERVRPTCRPCAALHSACAKPMSLFAWHSGAPVASQAHRGPADASAVAYRMIPWVHPHAPCQSYWAAARIAVCVRSSFSPGAPPLQA